MERSQFSSGSRLRANQAVFSTEKRSVGSGVLKSTFRKKQEELISQSWLIMIWVETDSQTDVNVYNFLWHLTKVTFSSLNQRFGLSSFSNLLLLCFFSQITWQRKGKTDIQWFSWSSKTQWQCQCQVTGTEYKMFTQWCRVKKVKPEARDKTKGDVESKVSLENFCLSAFSLSKRQLRGGGGAQEAAGGGARFVCSSWSSRQNFVA